LELECPTKVDDLTYATGQYAMIKVNYIWILSDTYNLVLI